jgi:polyisoprenoid-binding protein YceI
MGLFNRSQKTVAPAAVAPFESGTTAVDDITGSTTINRRDWGLTWNAALETGGVLVSEKIKLEFDVSAIATPATV